MARIRSRLRRASAGTGRPEPVAEATAAALDAIPSRSGDIVLD
ncbi:hypothetical protein [Streptomyces sp. NPDC048565]